MVFLIMLMFCWDVHPDTNEFKFYKNGAFIHDVTGNRTSVQLNNNETATFTVTAIKDSLESDPSAPVTFHAPRMQQLSQNMIRYTRPLAKANQEFVLESTTDFMTWVERTDYTEEVISIDDDIELVEITKEITATPHEFFRMRIKIRPEGCANMN